ncbi:MAG: aminotransferase class IV [Desulfosarcinaceae bacterium]|nr:aminotransferase class IV [Desulfosarcinaceae bacterium]
MSIYYVDGQYLPAAAAVIPVDDLALMRGYGVFDYLRTYAGKPLHLGEHVDRLISSADKIGLTLPWDAADIIAIVKETLARNDLADANVRILITGGSSSDFITPEGRPRLLVLVTPVAPKPADWYEEGVKIITFPSSRSIPGAKSIDYIPATMALGKAKKAGAVEALYVETDGQVRECTTSNIFAVVQGVIVTPGEEILAGITRKTVLALAKPRYPVEIRGLSLDQLLTAEEVFITGSGKGLVPVVQIDESVIGEGQPGPVSRDLMAELSASQKQ